MTRDPQHGAALLEVIIAVALTAMIAASLTSITGFGLRVVERADKSAANSTLNLLERRRITQILARVAAPEPDQPTLIGTSRRIIWRGVVSATDDGWDSGIWTFDADTKEMRRCQQFSDNNCSDLVFSVSNQNDDSYNFTYQDKFGRWSDTWSSNEPPVTIRIEVGTSQIDVAPRIAGATQ